MIIGINMFFLVKGKGGGIERYARSLVSALQRIDKKNEYVIFTNKDCEGSFDLTPNFTEVKSAVSARFRPAKIIWEQTALPFSLRSHQIDVLLSPGNIAPLFPGCPSAVIIHDLIPFIWPDLFTLTERTALQKLMTAAANRSSRVITVSQSSRKGITQTLRIDPAKITVVPGACSETFNPVPATAERTAVLAKYGVKAPYILYVASTRPYKNVDGLIRAFDIYRRKDRSKHSLVITGLAGRAHFQLVKLTEKLGLSESVVFAGFVQDKDLPAIYSAADLSVYPSFYEGFGLPLLESMACGTPVAASNATSLPEVLGDAGILFDPANSEEMAHTMSSIILDIEFKTALVRKGFERVKTYSWEKTAKAILTILEELVLKR